jgi:hypothetical protein
MPSFDAPKKSAHCSCRLWRIPSESVRSYLRWSDPPQQDVLLRELSLQFRSEFFNIFNRANFGNPTASLNSSSFGVITSSALPRDIQFGLKLVF